jgi:exopolysaccharide production protein ExoZ
MKKISENVNAGASGLTLYANIQGLRAIAALLVVLHHLAKFLQPMDSASFVRPFAYFGYLGVDIFFVISGVVVTLTSYSYIGKREYIITFIRKRVVRVYSNYWVILLFPLALLGLGVVGLHDGASVYKSIFLLPQAHDQQIIPIAWTLVHEVYFYAIFVFILLIPKCYFVRALGSWFCLILLINIIVAVIGQEFLPLDGFYVSAYQLEFIAGCLVAVCAKNKVSFFPKSILCAGVLLVCVTAVFNLDEGTFAEEGIFSRVVFYGAGAAMIVYGFVLIELLDNWKIPRFISSLGNSSYTLYLVHNLIFPILIVTVYYPFVEGHNSVFLEQAFVVFAIVLVVGYSMLHYCLVEKPLLDWCNGFFNRSKNICDNKSVEMQLMSVEVDASTGVVRRGD